MVNLVIFCDHCGQPLRIPAEMERLMMLSHAIKCPICWYWSGIPVELRRDIAESINRGGA